MTADSRPYLARLWSPRALPERGPLLVYYRLRLLTSLVGSLFPILLLALSIARFVFHLDVPVPLLLVILVIGMWNTVLVYAYHAAHLFYSGRWKGFNRQIVQRSDHPRKFWVWATFGVAATAISFASAGLLTWILIYSPPRF